METHLRPLTLGEILDRTAQLYRTNFLLFAGIASMYAGALLLFSLAQIGVEEFLRMKHWMVELTWEPIVAILVIWPVIVIAGGLAVAANNRVVAWLQLGEPATIRGAYASILPRLRRYLWLMTITTFIVWLPFVLVYVGYLTFAIVYIKPKGILTPHPNVTMDPKMALMFLGVTLGFGVLVLGALVYSTLMGLRYSLAVPACVIEDLPARQAIRRSIELTKGSRGRIFLLGLLVVAVQMGLGIITQVFFVAEVFKHHGQLPAAMRVLQQLVAFFTNTFVGPIYATGFTLFYYDQRVRKEGYDLEWMMQTAGMDHAPNAAIASPASETGIGPASTSDPHLTPAGGPEISPQ